jgi:hypothetical protein
MDRMEPAYNRASVYDTATKTYFVYNITICVPWGKVDTKFALLKGGKYLFKSLHSPKKRLKQKDHENILGFFYFQAFFNHVLYELKNQF